MTQPDVLVVMSQEAYTRFLPQLKPGGILIMEQDLVRVNGVPSGIRVYGVPATRLAEELGRKMVLNIVMVGFFGAVTALLDPDALRQAVADSVPELPRAEPAGLRQRLRIRRHAAARARGGQLGCGGLG